MKHWTGEQNLENPNPYLAILPLQLLLLKDLDPKKYSSMEQLMDHNKHRRMDEEYWNDCQENVVKHIQDKCNQKQFTEKEINRVIGVLEINGYQIHSNGPNGFRGIFPVVRTLYL